MAESEGKKEYVTGSGSAGLRKGLSRREIEHVLACLEAEMMRLLEELRVVRKMFREEKG